MHGGGPYEGAAIHFTLSLPPEYPQAAPIIRLITRLRHPLVHVEDGLFHHSGASLTTALSQFAHGWEERCLERLVPDWQEVKAEYVSLIKEQINNAPKQQGEIIKWIQLPEAEQAKTKAMIK